MKMLRTGMEIEFRPPAWGKYKNRFRPLMRGFIVDDFYTRNGHTHIFKIRIKNRTITMNGAALYSEARIISMDLKKVIKNTMEKEQTSGFNKMALLS